MSSLKNLLKEMDVKQNEKMSEHTTFKIGGAADFFVVPKNYDELVSLLRILKENQIRHMVLGKGSNVLFSDSGYKGVIISTEALDRIVIEEHRITASCGAHLSTISNIALENSLNGFEFASGIPGSIGGAVFMNAGAYGGEMKDVVEYVKAIDSEFNIVELDNSQCHFGKRSSVFHEEDMIVLEVGIRLSLGEKSVISELIEKYETERSTKQPLEYGSAGSVFKRPEGMFAGKLIQDCGLKGLRYGNAAVSSKHSGFIVNLGGATAHEVITLINIIRKTVFDRFGVELVREIRVIDNEDN